MSNIIFPNPAITNPFTDPVTKKTWNWNGEAWDYVGEELPFTFPFNSLDIVGGEATWDAQDNLNKIVSPDDDFTLNIENVLNGMVGILSINTVGASEPITMTLDTTPISNNGIGDLVLDEDSYYTFAWYYDSISIKWNIEKYL